MSIDQLKIDETKSEAIRSEMEKVDVLKKDVQKEAGKTAQDIIKGLTGTQLATFIDNQFKKGDAYVSADVMKENAMYTFAVQAGLDAASKDGRYENLLLGTDGKYGVDDSYGSRTRAAVEQFQVDAGIKKDGIVGPETMAKLVTVLNGSVVLDFKQPVIDGVEVYNGGKTETPAKDLSQKTAEGILTVDAYGNKVNYVDSKDKIPSANFNKPEFGKNVYEYKGFRVFGNGRVMNLTTNEMFDWKDLDAKVAANVSGVKLTEARTDTIPTASYAKEAINKDIFKVTFTDVENLFSGKALAESNTKIANGNAEVGTFLKNNTLKFYGNSNPNITINYVDNKNGYSINVLPAINIHSILKDDILDSNAIYTQLNKSIIDKIAQNKETDRKANVLKNYNETVSKIRGKKWTLEQLFPDKKDSKTYQGYFNRFENKSVTIDSSENYTRLLNNKLMFDFDESGARDADYSKNKSIDMTLITDANGKLDDAKFIAEIKKIVVASVELFKKDV